MESPKLNYPFENLPDAGTTREIVPGVKWLQMPLPFALDHINLYLIEDGDSWVLVDTGIRGEETQGHWERIFADELDGKPISRVIVTHMHPDHMGQAGWICRRFGAQLLMTRGEYYYARAVAGDKDGEMKEIAVDFFRRSGLPEDMIADIQTNGWGNYHKSVEPIPIGFGRLMDGTELTIGGRTWRVITGSGHSPEHACLVCDELEILVSGDQVLPRITSNVSVNPNEPDENPLQFWLDSHEKFLGLSDRLLVLPSHNKPFYGLHDRLKYLIHHHEDRMLAVEESCVEPQRAYDLLDVMFERELDSFQSTLALGECLSHLHCLMQRGRIAREIGTEGVYFYRSIDPTLPDRAHPGDHDERDAVPLMV